MRTLWIVLIVVGIVAAATVSYAWYQVSVPKDGWKVIKGCVAKEGKDINYQFFGKSDWQSVTPDMGCGKTYTDAETFGLKDYNWGNEINDVSQATIVLYPSKPSDYDQSAFVYKTVPHFNSLFLEFGRITATSGATTVGVSDSDWNYMKKSFKFK